MNVRGLLCTAVLSPLSPSAALLSLLQPDVSQHHLVAVSEAGTSTPTPSSSQLPDVVNSVLGIVYGIMDDGDRMDGEEGMIGPGALSCQGY